MTSMQFFQLICYMETHFGRKICFSFQRGYSLLFISQSIKYTFLEINYKLYKHNLNLCWTYEDVDKELILEWQLLSLMKPLILFDIEFGIKGGNPTHKGHYCPWLLASRLEN